MTKIYKRMIAIASTICLLGGVVFSGGIQLERVEAAEVTAKETLVTPYTNATPRKAPTNIPEGYVFAGWYQTDKCEEPLQVSGNGYAKFVDENIFRVKAQITANTTAETKKLAIRLVTSVDNINYSNVGFEITINGNARTITSKTVYKKLYAVGEVSGEVSSVTPEELFCSASEFFMTYTIGEIPNIAFDSVISVRARWVTQDGTVVFGQPTNKTIDMGIFRKEAVDYGMILNCDSKDYLVKDAGEVSVVSDECKEGAAALQMNCTSASDVLLAFNRGDKVVDISDYSDGYLHFWLYINDTSHLNSGGVFVELTSSGGSDSEELQWQITNLTSGWNEVQLSFASGTPTGNIDLEAIDYFRIYLYPSKSSTDLVLKLDDVRAVSTGIITNCDNETYYKSSDGTVTAIENEYKEGSAALRCKGSELVWYRFDRVSAPLDLKKYATGRLEFWLYINSVGNLSEDTIHVELSSSGTCDSEELEWRINKAELTNGWNRISLPIASPDKETGAINLSNVNFLRVWHQNTNAEALITILDDVRVVENEAQVIDTDYTTEDVVIADIMPTEMGYAVDATGVTDSSDGIQKALNDCSEAGGGTVYLPAGTYVISKRINIPSYVTLRGDWRDPDDTSKGDYGTIVKVEMTAETDPETFSDSAYHGVFELNAVSGVVGLTVCYPNQNLDNVVEYPHTFYVVGGMLPSVRDVTVINGYRGIGAAINPDGSSHESLQVENFKGTFLTSGLYLEYSADVGTVKNIVISNKYWLNCSLSGVQIPTEAALDTYTQQHATGITLGAVEWTEFVNVSITDCNIGVHTVKGRRSEQEIWFAGSFYDLQISECVTGLQADYLDTRWGMNVAKSSIAGSQHSIVNNINSVTNKAGFIQLCDVPLTGDKQDSQGKVVIDSTKLSEQAIQYEQSYIAPDNRMVIANLSDYTTGKDASTKLQHCLDWIYRAGGGIVYVPSGIYRFDKPLNVPEGVELRGASSVATRDISAKCGGTLFLCYYGDEGSGDGTAFITLDGKNAGVNGIRITYAQNGVLTNTTTNKTLKTTYTIRGKADGVYVVHSMIAGSGYGVDFGNCDNYYIDGVYTACYYTTYYLGGRDGVITGCLQNPTVYSRTAAPVERDTWGEEDTIWTSLYNTIRTNAHYIILEDARDALVYNNFAYGVMTMLSNVESPGTQVVNMGTDRLGPSSAQLVMDGGSLIGINILRCDTMSSEITDYLSRGVVSKAYKYIEGELKLHNRLKLWLKAGDVANEPAINKDNIKTISLANGDSLDRIHAVSYDLEISTTMKKEGTGAYYVNGKSKTRFEGQLTQTVDISANKNGNLHLWFYVNNTSNLAKDEPLLVKIGSSTTTNSLEWEIPLSELTSGGWKEIVLDLNSPTTVEGTIDFGAINYINVYQDVISMDFLNPQQKGLVTAVDDIRVVAPTESREIPDEKLVFGCGDSALTGSSNVRYTKYLNVPVNIKAYQKGALQVQLYINNVDNFTSASAMCIEIGSSRRCDCEELQWTIPTENLKTGWNNLTLSFDDATASGMAHLGAVDYLRIHCTEESSESLTTQLRDIYATLGKELGGNTTGGSDTSDWNEWFE